MSRTAFADFTRDDGESVSVEYERERYCSATGPSWNHPGDPAEGGQVTILKAHTEREGWAAKWSEEEDRLWTDWIEQTREPGELEGDDFEYDNWEDR